jgi:hypothetical protein
MAKHVSQDDLKGKKKPKDKEVIELLDDSLEDEDEEETLFISTQQLALREDEENISLAMNHRPSQEHACRPSASGSSSLPSDLKAAIRNAIRNDPVLASHDPSFLFETAIQKAHDSQLLANNDPLDLEVVIQKSKVASMGTTSGMKSTGQRVALLLDTLDSQAPEELVSVTTSMNF